MTETPETTLTRVRKTVFEMEDNLHRQRRTALLLRALGEGLHVEGDALLPIAEYLEILNEQSKADWDELREAVGLGKPVEGATE